MARSICGGSVCSVSATAVISIVIYILYSRTCTRRGRIKKTARIAGGASRISFVLSLWVRNALGLSELAGSQLCNLQEVVDVKRGQETPTCSPSPSFTLISAG